MNAPEEPVVLLAKVQDISERFVLAKTPVIKPRGCGHGYIVIRDLANQYVVHNVESDAAGKPISYYWGHYFPKGDPDAMKKAMRCFVGKILAWHSINDDRPRTLDPFHEHETITF